MVERVPIHQVEVLVRVAAPDVQPRHTIGSHGHAGHLLERLDHVALAHKRGKCLEHGGVQAYLTRFHAFHRVFPLSLHHQLL